MEIKALVQSQRRKKSEKKRRTIQRKGQTKAQAILRKLKNSRKVARKMRFKKHRKRPRIKRSRNKPLGERGLKEKLYHQPDTQRRCLKKKTTSSAHHPPGNQKNQLKEALLKRYIWLLVESLPRICRQCMRSARNQGEWCISQMKAISTT